ncbi:hypothetical protein [Phascolarctobacterium faecium]|uniref:hypothetical protein n=1 Tax=Phascolarctobacterium faecium TaxID=33025 RepID=UPI00399621F9
MRLIDADAAKMKLLKLSEGIDVYDEYFNGIRIGYKRAAHSLVTIPTVEERKHGHWVRHNDIIACSECIFDMCFDENIAELNYCPYCGAKMDGE